jgi:hypothetical protein
MEMTIRILSRIFSDKEQRDELQYFHNGMYMWTDFVLHPVSICLLPIQSLIQISTMKQLRQVKAFNDTHARFVSSRLQDQFYSSKQIQLLSRMDLQPMEPPISFIVELDVLFMHLYSQSIFWQRIEHISTSAQQSQACSPPVATKSDMVLASRSSGAIPVGSTSTSHVNKGFST